MKIYIKTISLFIVVIGLLASCRNEDLNPVPDWNYVLHGLGQIKSGSPVNFILGDNNSKIDFTLQWVSIDNQGTAQAMDVFVTWNEKYIDKDGNPQTANHGKRKITSLSNVGANRTDSEFSIGVNDIRTLFSDAMYDYGNGSVSVFANPLKPRRTAQQAFLDDDAFIVSWAILATDGKYFDSWSASVCGDFQGANCTIPFFVVCNSSLDGTYDMTTVGWCGDSFTGKSRWNKSGDGAYTMYTQIPDGELLDMSFGAYMPCYGYGLEAGTQGSLPNGSVTLNDVCNTLSYTGTSQWGEVFSLNSVSSDGANLIIDFINDYGEGGVTTFTRTDGTTWPPLSK